MLKFLAGLLIAIGIGFALYIFLFENYYENIADQNFAKLYNGIKIACEEGSAKVNFELPQKQILLPFTTLGEDPYFYVYYERFPPEPPYQFGKDIPQTVEAIFIPWSEDLPWSSNLLTTATMDMLALGVDVLNIKGTVKGMKDTAGKVMNKVLSSEELEELKDAVDSVENGLSKVYKKGKIVVEKGKLALQITAKETKYLVAGAAIGTIACMYFTDKTLGECAIIATGVYATIRISYKVLPKIYDAINEYFTEKGIRDVLEALEGLRSEDGAMVTSINEFIEKTKDGIEVDGKVIKLFEEVDGEYIVKDPDYQAALERYWAERGFPEKIEYFTFETDDKGVLQKIRFLKDEFKNAIKEKILYPIESKLKPLIGDKISKYVGLPEDIEAIGEQAKLLEDAVEADPYKLEALKRVSKNAIDQGINLPFNPERDTKEMIEWWTAHGIKLKEEGKLGKILLVDKDSYLASIFATSPSTSDVAREFNRLLFEVAPNDPKESERIVNLMLMKEFRIREGVETVLKGPIGYSLLRIQDLYTPLGATYWDKQVSFYTHTGTYCDIGQLCLQKGYHVTHLELPKPECEGVKYVKLKRGSIVASDPNFYLVSPCKAELIITKGTTDEPGDTIFVEPKLCNNYDPNYCYATASLVNWWIGLEATAAVAECVVNVIFTIATAGLNLLGALKSCIGFGVPGPVSFLGDFIKLALDVFREGVITYPSIPDWIQPKDLACSW
jgi:hypothetical protein